MNNLVKTLLAKTHLDVMENLGEIETNIVAERFAKLIVLECISTLSKDDGATHHEELLLERFGL